MRIQFKTVALMLITSVSLQAQIHNVYSNSFVTNKNTTAIFNISNTAVAIEESNDNKVHISYTIDFEGYSKNEIKEKLEEIKVEVSDFENHITLNAHSKNQISFASIKLNSPYGISMTDDYNSFESKKDTIVRKSKDSIIKLIQQNRFSDVDNPLKFINARFKKIDKDGEYSDFKKSGVSILLSNFLIKIPPYLKLTINGKGADITVKNDFKNELNVVMKNGSINARQLLNTHNKFKLEDASFEAEGLTGGNYKFVNSKNGLIGSVQNVNITSEFSKFEIGEIHESTTITDFNSEYWFYNWAIDFERFNLYSEYSKIHFFYPKRDHSLKVFGNNTKNFVDNYVIEMQPTSKGEKYNMMYRKPQGLDTFSGDIYFDIIHGIIYSHDDSIKTINKQ